MRHILNIAFTQDYGNFDEVIDYRGTPIRFTQYATNFNVALTEDILQRFDGLCDAIAISGLPPVVKTKKGVFSHPIRDRLLGKTKETHTLDGQMFKEIYTPWEIRKFVFQNPHLLKNKDIAFYSGALQKPLLEVLEEFCGELQLADPYFVMGLPMTLRSQESLERFVQSTVPVIKRMKMTRRMLHTFDMNSMSKRFLKDFYKSDVFVGNMATVDLIDLKHLEGKTVVLDVLNDVVKEKLNKAGTEVAIVCLPQVIGIPFLNFAIYEAILQVFQAENKRLTFDDILARIEEFDIRPEVVRFANEPIQTSTTNIHYL